MRAVALGLLASLTLAAAGCNSDGSTSTAMPVETEGVAAASPSAKALSTLTATTTSARRVGPTPRPPPIDAFTGTGQLSTPRSLHTATALEDGRVLIAGGSATFEGLLASAELFQPGSPAPSAERDPQHPAVFMGAFFETGAMNEARQAHAAARLADGRVLITGGVAEGGAAATLASAEIYDPATGEFELAGEMTVPRLAHGSALLPDGRVLVVGGSGNPYVAETELFDPVSGEFSITGAMQVGR